MVENGLVGATTFHLRSSSNLAFRLAYKALPLAPRGTFPFSPINAGSSATPSIEVLR